MSVRWHNSRDYLKGFQSILLVPTCYFNPKSFSLCLQERVVHFQHRCVTLKQVQRVLPETHQATGWREGWRLKNRTEKRIKQQRLFAVLYVVTYKEQQRCW